MEQNNKYSVTKTQAKYILEKKIYREFRLYVYLQIHSSGKVDSDLIKRAFQELKITTSSGYRYVNTLIEHKLMYRTKSGLWLVGRKAWHKDKECNKKEKTIKIDEEELDILKELLYTFLVETGKVKRSRTKGESKKHTFAMSIQEEYIGLSKRTLSRIKKNSISINVMYRKSHFDHLIDVPKTVVKSQIQALKKSFPELINYLAIKYSGILDIYYVNIRGLDTYHSILNTGYFKLN